MEIKSNLVEIRGKNAFNYTDKKTGEIKEMYQIAVEDNLGMPEVIIVDRKSYENINKGDKVRLVFNKTNKGTYYTNYESK